MGSWNHVFSYDEEISSLEDVRVHCQIPYISIFPTNSHEKAIGLEYDGWFIDDETVSADGFRLKAIFPLAVRLLVRLSQRCGQLIVCNDTGAWELLVQPTDDPEVLYDCFDSHYGDSGIAFFTAMFST